MGFSSSKTPGPPGSEGPAAACAIAVRVYVLPHVFLAVDVDSDGETPWDSPLAQWSRAECVRVTL